MVLGNKVLHFVIYISMCMIHLMLLFMIFFYLHINCLQMANLADKEFYFSSSVKAN